VVKLSFLIFVANDNEFQGKMENKLSKQYISALREYGLIESGDKILVGLSGGKDSLLLLHMLAKSLAFPKMDIEVIAVHVSMNNIDYGVNLNDMQRLCDTYKIPFFHEECSFEPSDKKDVCFLCSWTRRKALFEIAKRNDCNKIALGHHKDDILETLLMNMMFQGSISTIPPRLSMDKFPQTLIRPLCLMEEKDIIVWAEEAKLPKSLKLCPYEKQSKRAEVRVILEQMAKLSPGVKSCLWNSMENVMPDYLPQKV
jgi:tRNA(Ile)-lysidine synthase TilS/MesJ